MVPRVRIPPSPPLCYDKQMIKVIHYENETAEKQLEAHIADYYQEVRELLPDLPETIQIYFGSWGIIPDTGVGGYAYAHDIITISVDPEFGDKEKQLVEIRPTVFHEAFHIYQKFTGESGPFSALENAAYEGMAMVFERENCGIWQSYGDYRNTQEERLDQWLQDIQQLSLKEFQENYKQWKFYHPVLKEHWILYRVGTWMIDKILKEHNLSIFDLSTKTATEVLDLYSQ